MAIQDTYLDNVFIQWNEVGGQKVVLGIDNEQKKIFNNIAVLNQIPDIATGVVIDGMFEIKNNQEITLPSQFKVNYANGFITFHPDLDNTTVTISHYAGRGIIYYPSSRIYTQMSQDGTTVEQTFQNFVDTINEYQYMGVYNNSTTYQTNQQVYYNGSTYIAISTTLGNLPTNDNYWRILSAGNNFSGDFSDIIQYYQRDCVQYNKAIYQCISRPPIGTLPTNITYWIQMVSLNDIYTDYINVLKPDILSATANANNARYKGDYNASVEYKVNNIIRYANSLYICKLDSVGNLPTDTTYWDESTKAFTWKNTFNITTDYKVFDVVEYLGSSYVCINNSTGNIPTDTTYFNIIALKGEKGATLSPKGAYDNEVTYLKDDLVFYNAGGISGVYYAKQTTIGNLPTNTAYWDVFITGGGNMNTAIYDTENTGTVDDSKKLGGQLPNYYTTAQDFNEHKAETVSQNDGVHGLKIESGTWTPVLEGATVAGNNTYSTQIGTYHKIGKYVRLNFRVVITAKDESMSGALRIGGIPFANARVSNLSDAGRLWDAKGWIAPLNFNQLTIYGSVPTKIALIKLSDKGNASELVAPTEFGNEIGLGGTFDYITS